MSPLGAHEYLAAPEKPWRVQKLEDGSPALRIANKIRDEVNEILARYDIPCDAHERDVSIDAACVMLADFSLKEWESGK